MGTGDGRMTGQINYYEEKEGLKLLDDLKSGCLAADYKYSKVTDIDDHEVDIPAIMLKETLGNKDDFIGRAVMTAWRALSVNAFESYLFLCFQFEGKGEFVFNISMSELEMSLWLHTVIDTGAIIICDKSGEFDIGITNIPTDIPIAHLYVQKLRADNNFVGG